MPSPLLRHLRAELAAARGDHDAAVAALREAIARGEAGIDHCPPGGDAGARALARLLDVPAKPYDRARGSHMPPQVALVVEADCIGCTKCIVACPVDAIAGGSKLMHAVIEPLCTGCELCVPACPVDCIVMVAPQSSSAMPAASSTSRTGWSCDS